MLLMIIYSASWGWKIFFNVQLEQEMTQNSTDRLFIAKIYKNGSTQ